MFHVVLRPVIDLRCGKQIFGIRKGGYPPVAFQLGVPTHVIRMQMSAADEIDVRRIKAGVLEPGEVRELLQVPLGNQGSLLVVSNTGVHQKRASIGLHDEAVERQDEPPRIRVREAGVPGGPGDGKLSRSHAAQQKLRLEIRPLKFQHSLNLEGSGQTHGHYNLTMNRPHRTLLWLTLYAVAMAHVEAALVVHLRELYYPDDPRAIFPLVLLSHRDLAIELARELATVLMILSVSALARRHFTGRFAAFLFVFGLWDIFYYIWLKVMIGWPTSWWEWDVLFLIPWPWLGPWVTPALIALLFVVWGGWTLTRATAPVWSRATRALFGVGAVTGVAAFLIPGAPLLSGGEAAFRGLLPDGFPWGLYWIGVGLMATSLLITGFTSRREAS